MRALKMLGADDCFRTAIACLLDCRDPSEVPHVYAGTDDPKIGFALMREFLATRALGMAVFGTPGDFPLSDILENISISNPGMYYILIGSNKRGVNHAVVCCDNMQIHDPAWAGTGIHSPGDLGIYAIVLIVPLSQFTTD